MKRLLSPQLISLMLISVSLYGCSTFEPRSEVIRNMMGKTETSLSERSERQAALYRGEECNEVLYGVDEHISLHEKAVFQESESVAHDVLGLVCPRYLIVHHNTNVPQGRRVEGFDWDEAHASFNDRRFSHLNAALLAVSPHLSHPTLPAQVLNPTYVHDEYKSDIVKKHGIANAYGQMVDRDALTQELAQTTLSQQAQDVFVELFEVALRDYAANRAALSQELGVFYFERPLEVVRERQEMFAAHSDLYARFDSLVLRTKETKGTDEITALILDFLTLREDYIAQVDEEDLRITHLYPQISEQLALLYIENEDAGGVFVETSSYLDGMLFVSLAQQLSAQNHIMFQYVKTRDYLVEHAIKNGLSEDAALTLATQNMQGVEIAPAGGGSMPNYYKAMRPDSRYGPELIDGVVKSMKAQNDQRVKLVFETVVSNDIQPYDCHETDKISGVNEYGDVFYKKICKYKSVKRTYNTPIIVVPAFEAKSIKRGDSLTARGEGDLFHIESVARDGKLVQKGAHVLMRSEQASK